MAKITITELAKRLGVSACTVNKALSGKPKVSDTTRRRVLAEAERLGYRPNRMAQVLARNPIRLAYVHPDHFPSFFGRFEAGVRAASIGWPINACRQVSTPSTRCSGGSACPRPCARWCVRGFRG